MMATVSRPELISLLSDIRQARARFLEHLRGIRADVRPRVLVVDDNRTYARLLQSALDRRGVRADMVFSAEAVCPALKEARYDLLVLDSVCPCADGTYQGVPALCVSGADGEHVSVSKVAGIERIADEVVARVRA